MAEWESRRNTLYVVAPVANENALYAISILEYDDVVCRIAVWRYLIIQNFPVFLCSEAKGGKRGIIF